ncbi:phage exclusion protein Lit family protein [Bradyrhizobium sp. LLZ17]|uniref:Phage exclusion protein Lit family protein n=1 Tax=Bradyrhizobium sp. LLZ17 TaxID=3239388 RepID=A0AB39XFX1_9BRAD
MSENEVRDDHSLQTAVRDLFIGSAPERESDLVGMWKELDLIFQLTPDMHEGDRIIMDAGAYRYIRFNHRVLRAFWIGGYAAWEGYRTVAESPSLQALDLTRFRELVSAYESCLASTEADLEALPVGVAEPGQYPDANIDPQGRAASELATIAVAWALLHELRHIRHQREGTGADPHSEDKSAKHAEELSCDAFATTFLLEQIDLYATGQSADLVRQKRQLGIYFGLFAVTLLAKDKWGESKTHPAVQVRIDAVRTLMADQKSDIAAAMAHFAFAVLGIVWPGAPSHIRESRTSSLSLWRIAEP